ncbi:MAG TPA: class I SAM-dependent methyltransferase [Acidimicrobiales bacterium]|nr:class I SAM-dependent methyltransferase [Acidimicrobiales bacterium]
MRPDAPPLDVARHFGPLAERYDEVFDATPGLEAINRLELAVIRRRLGDVAGRRVLDAGMGTGRLARLLTDAGAEVVGVDLTAEMLARARRRVPEAGAVIARVGVPLPFADRAFDDIVCIRVLKYFAGWSAAFEELRRVLRPGGRLVVEIANRRSIARWGYGDLAVRLGTVAETRSLLRGAGFLPLAGDAGTRLPLAVFRRPGRRVARVAGGIEAAAARALGGTALARSVFITSELPA